MKKLIIILLLLCTAVLLSACAETTTQEIADGDKEHSETMLQCNGKGGFHTQIIYIGDHEGYEKYSLSQGSTERAVSGKKICWLEKYSTGDKPLDCTKLSSSEYDDELAKIQQLTVEPEKSNLGLECTEVPYDDTVFILE